MSQLSPIPDDPSLDGTDGAHPAYWRGHEHAYFTAHQMIWEALGLRGWNRTTAEHCPMRDLLSNVRRLSQ